MTHSKHYFRAGGIVVGGFFAFLIVRAFLMPKSFGQYGHYRADNVAEQRAKPLAFGAISACGECHAEQAMIHGKGKHQTVQCQNCHAPLAVHIQEGVFQEPMPINRLAALCLRCHGELPSRPEGFPQIDVKKHLGGMAPEGPSEGVCLRCHRPHDPIPARRRS